MIEKIQVLVIYALTGLLIALWPILIRFAPTFKTPPDPKKFLSARVMLAVMVVLALILVPVLITFSTATSPPLIALVSTCAIIAITLSFHWGKFMPMTAICIFAALLLTITLLWWHRGQLTWLEVIVFTILVLVVMEINRHTESRTIGQWTKAIQNLGFLLGTGLLSFVTTQLHDERLLVAWHHWSAYIGPSELVLAGARLFLDIPAQYGLGPTLIIASVCGHSCWEGMYYLVGVATILYAIVIAYLALSINHENDSKRGMPRWLVLVLTVTCCFFWAGYPENISLSLVYPSAGALRFLPALFLVTLLIRADHQFQNERRFSIWGHISWCVAALWSPESGFYATCVWWPYFILLRASKSNDLCETTVCLFRAFAELLLVAIGLVAVFNSAFWMIYRTTPSISTFFAYALNPPGPLPIDPNGSIWFFIAIVILASINNWQSFQQKGNTPSFRRGLLLLLLTYSTFSYYLGRSHDNNILNIMPFIFLVLLQIFSTSTVNSVRTIAALLLASLVGWSSTFGWKAWLLPSQKLRNIEFDPSWAHSTITDMAINQPPAAHAPFPADAIKAISEIQRSTAEPVTVISSWNGLASTNADSVWSAFHGPANILNFPSATRRKFLANTAITLKRSGWLIVPQSALNSALVQDFDAVYNRTVERDFETFHAIRYAPKL